MIYFIISIHVYIHTYIRTYIHKVSSVPYTGSVKIDDKHLSQMST